MKYNKLKTVLPASVLATSALGLAAPAQAMDFEVSGQVDRALIFADNGEESDFGSVDNTGSNTRFRFTGAHEFDNGLEVGFIQELAFSENPSASWDINNTSSTGQSIDIRKADIYLEGVFGRLSLGQGDGAANGTSEVGYSGTEFLGGGNNYTDYGGGVTFVTEDGVASGIAIGDTMSSFDGLSRNNRVRYDTPAIGPLVLSASVTEGQAYELAARMEQEFGDGGIVGVALDYVDTNDRGIEISPTGEVVDADSPFPDTVRFQEWGGSAGLLLPMGLNFTVAYKHRETDEILNEGVLPTAANGQRGYDADSMFAGIGYRFGQHNFQINWAQVTDLYVEGSEATQYGAAYVFDWTDSVELYASYHLYNLEIDDSDADFQDINQVFIGSRVKFL